MKCGTRLAKQGKGVAAGLPNHETNRETDLDGSARKRKPLSQGDSNPVQPGQGLRAQARQDGALGRLAARHRPGRGQDARQLRVQCRQGDHYASVEEKETVGSATLAASLFNL